MHTGIAFWKTFCQYLTNLNILFPYDSAIVFLDSYPKKLKMYVHTKTYTQKFVAPLFIIIKMEKM